MADLLDRIAVKNTPTPSTSGDLLDRIAKKPTPEKSFTQKALEFGAKAGLKGLEFERGLGAGALSTMFEGGDLIRRGLGMERVIQRPEVQAAITPPDTGAGRAGKFTEQAAEFLIPESLGLDVAKAGKGATLGRRALQLAKRSALEAGKAGTVAAVQSGGQPKEVAKAAAVGGAFPVAGAASRGALKYATDLLGFRTGVGGEAVRIATSTASQKFKDAMRNKITEAEIVGDTRSALESVKDARGAQYRSQLAALPNVQINVVQPVKSDLLKTLKNDYGIGIRRKMTTQPTGIIGPNGQPLTRKVPGNLELDFSHSTISDAGDQKKVLDLVTDLDGWKDQSTTGVDTLKRRVDDLYADTSSARQIIQKTKDSIRTKLNQSVPGYQKMTRDYALASKFIDEVNKEFSLKGGTGTVVRKLAYALNQNNEYRKLMLEALGKASGTDLKEMIAGSSMRETLPRGLVGRGLLGGEILGVVRGEPHLTAAALMDMLASSPRAVGEIMSMISTLRRNPVVRSAAPVAAQAGKAGTLEATQ